MISVGLFLAAPACSQSNAAEAQSDAQKRNDVDVLWGVKIPMRDGVKLSATIYKPTGQTDPLPVVFTLTPYNADTYHARAMYFARNGFVFALVDCRGRGNSGGQFEPFVNEGLDGYDIVEWLAGQPWSNGKVAMWGGSYAGSDQWSTLKAPNKTRFPQAARKNLLRSCTGAALRTVPARYRCLSTVGSLDVYRHAHPRVNAALEVIHTDRQRRCPRSRACLGFARLNQNKRVAWRLQALRSRVRVS